MNPKIQGQSSPFEAKTEKYLIIYDCIPSILLDAWHSLYRKLFTRLWLTFVDNFVLKMLDLGGGQWSITLKNRGQ